tara:strand:- start:1138 stop:2190 length:1053 start_codon:yes stop_codon:yes gene_type:complete
MLFSVLLQSYFLSLASSLLNLFVDIGFIYGIASLTAIFFSAGLDKYNSKDWISGNAFKIFAMLPHYRLFTVGNKAKEILSRLSKLISHFELVQQIIIPVGSLILVLCGANEFFYVFLGASTIFMLSLIYPFNLNPIGFYGLFIILFLNNLSYQIFQIELSILLSLILFAFIAANMFYLDGNFMRTYLGLHRCVLFTERHLHGLLILDPSHPISHFKSINTLHGLKIKRLFTNNQLDVTLLRLLDVLDRASLSKISETDALFMVEFHKLLFKNSETSGTVKLAQLKWDNESFISSEISISTYDSFSMNRKYLEANKSILPYENYRRNNLLINDYKPGFSPYNIKIASKGNR